MGLAVLDLLVYDGIDITEGPLGQRKALLAELLDPCPDNVLAVAHFDAGAGRIFEDTVRGRGPEGLVAKRLGSLYVPGVRSVDL